jgi:glycosyltransferase involved in cell wall biosynthesis
MARHTGTEVHRLTPITDSAPDADSWADAMWIGQCDQSDLDTAQLHLVGGDRFVAARLLVWDGDQVRGFVEVPIAGDTVDVAALRAELTQLPQAPTRPAEWDLPAISVVVCTRDHPEALRSALESLTCVDYPTFEVIVVDNNPRSGLTPPAVDALAAAGIPVRVVDAFGQGLSIARNVGINDARHEIVAFIDDDVVVDRLWLKNLAYGFAQGEAVACVCGMAATAELVTPAQSYFDRRVGWASCRPAVYDLAAPPDDEPLFPLRVAAFGTGANFAIRKDVVRGLGGFDEGLGIGSPAGGGEDVDIFLRVLLAGRMLVRAPSAVIWHRHRRTVPDLSIQIRNYGLGLGAWSCKLLCRPRTFAMVIRRLLPGIRHLRGVTAVVRDDTSSGADLDGLHRRELVGVLSGPWALARSRFVGRSATPLKSRSAMAMRMFDFRRGQMWGDPGNSIAAGRFSLAAVVLALVGALGAVSALPPLALAFVIGVFMLAGPGLLVLSWYTHLPTYASVALVPAVGVALCIIVVSGLLMLGFYSPAVVLLGMTGAIVVGGLMRCSYLAHRDA